MTVHKCDYQLLPPPETPYPPAREHPDEVVAARFATVARAARPRRFALCQAFPARPDTDDMIVRPMYQGLRNPDGTCVLLIAGQPYGYYRDIDAAFHHADCDELYLVWLEPEHDLPDAQASVAAVETRDNDASVWMVAVPFIAHGPTDARVRALEIADHLEPVTPGLTRRSALLITGTDPSRPVTLYCPIGDCLREPFHHGEHDPLPDSTPEVPEMEASP